MFHLLLVFLLFVMSGCTTLGVKVEIFNPLGVTAEDTLEATAKREVANHSNLLHTNFYSKTAVDLKSQISEFLKFLSSVQCPDKKPVMATGDLPRFTVIAKSHVENTISAVVKERNEGLNLLRQATGMKKEEKKLPLASALDKFSSANKMLADLSAKSQQSYDDTIKAFNVCLKQTDSPPNLETLNKIMTRKRETETSLEQRVDSLTGGVHLLDDPLAPMVIAAPDEFWEGVYNETQAFGTMGNTDIAIKMETVGSFTIKGLRVDTSKVTEATFDVLKQSIRMVAAAYGVPLPASENKPQQQGEQTPTDLVMSADEVRQSADRKRLLSRTAALTLLDLIVSVRSDLAADPKRMAAIQNLKRSFEAYKGQLAGN
jgi:hypothetical protein